MMRLVPAPTQTVNMATGETTESITNFQLLPPAATACQTCAKNPAHPPDQPHDALSLYYHYAFYAEHKRWPTWKDAVAHCPEATKMAWENALRALGKWTEPE